MALMGVVLFACHLPKWQEHKTFFLVYMSNVKQEMP